MWVSRQPFASSCAAISSRVGRVDGGRRARLRVVQQIAVVVREARKHVDRQLAHAALRARNSAIIVQSPSRALLDARFFVEADSLCRPSRFPTDRNARSPRPSTAAPIARSIGPRLERDAVAVRVDGALKDLTLPIEHDARVEIVTRTSADGLELLRHDAAHVMAEAVKELYPETQVTIGPAIENGFYYDFARSEPFTPEDLERIEKRMHEIVARDEKIVREVWDRDAAVSSSSSRASATRPRSSARSPPASRSRCTAKATSSICAAARTCRRRAGSARASSS